MNLVSAVTWSWRALRGHSITFSALFASAVLGVSVMAGFRHALSRLGAPWYVWLIVPILVVGQLAKKEAEWVPEPTQRRRWARRLFFGSILIAFLITWLRPSHAARASMSEPPVAGR